MNDYLNKLNAQRFPNLEHFRNLVKKISKYGLSDNDCNEAIQGACDFFGMSMPLLIEDMTNNPKGQTMFVNMDEESMEDDVLCYNLEELRSMGVRS